MKIFAVVSVARQVDGEMCVVKIEKAYTSASRADEQSKTLAKNYKPNSQVVRHSSISSKKQSTISVLH